MIRACLTPPVRFRSYRAERPPPTVCRLPTGFFAPTTLIRTVMSTKRPTRAVTGAAAGGVVAGAVGGAASSDAEWLDHLIDVLAKVLDQHGLAVVLCLIFIPATLWLVHFLLTHTLERY